jgi:hypothetical protein
MSQDTIYVACRTKILAFSYDGVKQTSWKVSSSSSLEDHYPRSMTCSHDLLYVLDKDLIVMYTKDGELVGTSEKLRTLTPVGSSLRGITISGLILYVTCGNRVFTFNIRAEKLRLFNTYPSGEWNSELTDICITKKTNQMYINDLGKKCIHGLQGPTDATLH